MRNTVLKAICLVLALMLAFGLSACAASAAGGTENNTAVQEAPQDNGAEDRSAGSDSLEISLNTLPFKASFFRVGWKEYDGPRCYLFSDSESLAAYYLAQKSDRPEQAREDISAYDDAWFAKHQLIVVHVDENSGSVRHRVVMVTRNGNKVRVSLERIAPEVGTCDMASWRIFIEVDKNFSADSEIEAEFISLSAPAKKEAK